MFNTIRKHAVATLCAVALILGASAVEGQSEDPILDDEPICSIQVGETTWVVPAALQLALEAHLGQSGTLELMRDLLGRLPPATPTNAVRIEGGYPGVSVAQQLDALGYVTETVVDPTEVPGALTGVLRTQ